MNFVALDRKIVAISLIAFLSVLGTLMQTSPSPAAAVAGRVPTGYPFDPAPIRW